MYIIFASRYVISIRLTLRCTHTAEIYTYVSYTCRCIHIYLRFRLPRVTRRRRAVVARHSSIISCIAARELSLFAGSGFVGKPNVSECARAYVWPRVSRVHVRQTKRRERKAVAEGARGMRESRVRRIYYDLLAGSQRSVCHPCPSPSLPLRPFSFPLALSAHPPLSSLLLPLSLLSYSPSILVILRRVTPLSFRRRSKNKVPDSRCMNDNLIAERP